MRQRQWDQNVDDYLGANGPKVPQGKDSFGVFKSPDSDRPVKIPVTAGKRQQRLAKTPWRHCSIIALDN